MWERASVTGECGATGEARGEARGEERAMTHFEELLHLRVVGGHDDGTRRAR